MFVSVIVWIIVFQTRIWGDISRKLVSVIGVQLISHRLTSVFIYIGGCLRNAHETLREYFNSLFCYFCVATSFKRNQFLYSEMRSLCLHGRHSYTLNRLWCPDWLFYHLITFVILRKLRGMLFFGVYLSMYMYISIWMCKLLYTLL